LELKNVRKRKNVTEIKNITNVSSTSKKIADFRGYPGPLQIHGTTQVLAISDILINSTVFAWLRVLSSRQTDRQTDRQTTLYL